MQRSRPRKLDPARASTLRAPLRTCRGFAAAGTIREYLINGIGELRFTPGHIEVALRRRTHTPAMLDANYQTKKLESHGGAAAPSATASPPAEPQPN